MGKWNFKAAQLNSSGGMNLVDLSPAQKARVKSMPRL